MISLACLNYPHPAIGTRIGRVKVIFRLPDRVAEFGSNRTMPAPEEWAEHGPLAYVEWFAKLPVCSSKCPRVRRNVGLGKGDRWTFKGGF